jgi:hypothetical protein
MQRGIESAKASGTNTQSPFQDRVSEMFVPLTTGTPDAEYVSAFIADPKGPIATAPSESAASSPSGTDRHSPPMADSGQRLADAVVKARGFRHLLAQGSG